MNFDEEFTKLGRRINRAQRWFVVWWFACVLAWVTGVGAVVWVIAHFLGKVW